ncbi:MAG TPA: hypothetical protein VGI86_21550 [Acidimicrobiia bacterium]
MSDIEDTSAEPADIYHPQVGDTEAILSELREMVDTASTYPLSSSPRVNRDDVLGLIDEALGALPLELREARWVLNERDEVVDRGRKEADEIIAVAQRRAAALVANKEIVREAERRAEQIIRDADDWARHRKHEADDYVDQKLAAFEIVLERTMTAVRRGRDRLELHVGTPALAERTEEPPDDGGFFDQDN